MVYLEKQVEQFERVRGNITEVLGPAQAHRFVANALFLISVGSNDIFEYVLGLNNITLPNDEFIPFLTLTYTLRIQVYTFSFLINNTIKHINNNCKFERVVETIRYGGS